MLKGMAALEKHLTHKSEVHEKLDEMFAKPPDMTGIAVSKWKELGSLDGHKFKKLAPEFAKPILFEDSQTEFKEVHQKSGLSIG